MPDEHYVQTLLAQKGLEGEITRRSLTHTAWDISSSRDRERRGWHPLTYKLSDATTMLLKSIKDIDHIYYETEYRREWCSSKGKPSKCFLFARKFTRAAALKLLNMGPYQTVFLRPKSWRQEMKLRSFVAFQLVDKTFIPLNHRFYSRSHSINLSKGKAFQAFAFKGRAQNDESDHSDGSSKCTKTPVPFTHTQEDREVIT